MPRRGNATAEQSAQPVERGECRGENLHGRRMHYGWQQVRVRDLVSSGALQVSDGYRVTNAELGESGVPFVRGGDIGHHGEISHAVDDYIRPEFADRVQGKLTRAGDVAFITKGTVGRVGLVRGDQPEMVFAPQVCYWRSLDHSRFHPRFLFYLLRGSAFQASLDAVKTHGSMAADYVSIADQQTFVLDLPPVEEQRAIAEVLGALDDRIELNRQLGRNLEEVLRAAFREFVLLAPDVPAWESGALDAEVRFLNGQALQKYPPIGSESLPVIKIGELRTGVTARSARAGMNVPSVYVVDAGDLLFSWSGSLEVVVWTGGRGALNQHLFKVTSERFPRWFVRQWLLEHLPTFRAIAADKATTMGHIQRRHLTETCISVPPAPDLARLHDLLEPLDEQIVRLAVTSREIAAVRDALLPRLLSGELRIRDAEHALAEAGV